MLKQQRLLFLCKETNGYLHFTALEFACFLMDILMWILFPSMTKAAHEWLDDPLSRSSFWTKTSAPTQMKYRLPISRHPFLQIIVQSTVTKDVELIKWPPSMCVGKRMNTWRVVHCYYFYRWELVVTKQWWRSHNQYKLLMLSVQT